MFHRVVVTSVLCCALLVRIGLFGGAASAEPTELKKGRVIKILSLQAIEPGKTKVGTDLRFEILVDVRSQDGSVLIARGTAFGGKVTKSKVGSGWFQSSDQIRFSCDPVTAVDGSIVQLDSTTTDSQASPDGSASVAEGQWISAVASQSVSIDPSKSVRNQLSLASAVQPEDALKEPRELKKDSVVLLTSLQAMQPVKTLVGTDLTFAVRIDVRNKDGFVLIPRGGLVKGKVTASKGEHFGRREKLDFEVDPIDAVDGTQVPVSVVRYRGGPGVYVIGSEEFDEGDAVRVITNQNQMIAPKNRLQPLAAQITPVQTEPDQAKLAVPGNTSVPEKSSPFRVLFSVASGSSILGKIENTGSQPSAVELIIFVLKDGKAVGSGTAILPAFAAGETRSFSVPIKGQTDGTIDIAANPKSGK